MITTQCWEEQCMSQDVVTIDEVWFDYGFAANSFSKFIAGKVVCDHDHPVALCRTHVADGAAEIAHQSLASANKMGFYPQRWWVRFANGIVVGGHIFPPPCMN